MKLLLTCEHGGNSIPEAYKNYFNQPEVLETHRAYDLGALELFNYLKPLANSYFYSETSRLLVELNRSLSHNQLFSEFSKKLAKANKTKILEQYYFPYRTAVENNIAKLIASQEQVLHFSIHSFTPELSGEIRNCDIGLLFDSRNRKEKEFCKKLKTAILIQSPNLNVRYNYPYLGKADGFTSYLRKQFPRNYLGIEIEINQKYVLDNVLDLEIKQKVFSALKTLKELN